MSFIKTADILIRNKNKLYLQVNYNLDDVVKIKEVGIIIDGTLYLSNYFTLNYSVFDLSFLKDKNTYDCQVCIKYITEEETTINVTYNVLTEDEYNVITESNSYNVVTEDYIESSTNNNIIIYEFKSNIFTITTNFLIKKQSIIKIYEYDETDFDNNGLGILLPKNAIVTRDLNDYKYCLDLTHPFDKYNKWKLLQEDRIIKANNQLFRIKHVTKTLSDITVYAEHIFFDLQNNFIEDTNIVEKNGRVAIDQILTNTSYPHHFSGTSNITNITSSRMVRKNVVSALIGSDENSFINRWGGEIDMDWLSFNIDNRIGQDRGYKIAYGKNLTGLNAKFDMTNVVTRIRPVGFDGIELSGNKYVDSPLINNYSMPIIREYKYENVKWTGSPNYSPSNMIQNSNEEEYVYTNINDARNKLIELAKKEFTDNQVDIPTTTYDINFKELSKTEEYKDYLALTLINIGDDVTIKHEKLGINIPARCIEYKYNCLTQEYDNITLGYYNKNFFNETSNTTDKINNVLQGIDSLPQQLNDYLQKAKEDATNLINNGFGG